LLIAPIAADNNVLWLYKNFTWVSSLLNTDDIKSSGSGYYISEVILMLPLFCLTEINICHVLRRNV